MGGIIYQINLKPDTPGERGLPKLPVQSARVTFQGLEGDFNRYRHEKKRDNPDRAVLLHSLEFINYLAQGRFHLQPGHLGENITTKDIWYFSMLPGSIYRIGEAMIQITEACRPCTNLKFLPYVGDQRLSEFMRLLDRRRGWYAKVLQEGMVRKGDSIEELL